MDYSATGLRFARAPQQLSCELGDEIAILNPESKLYFGMSGVAATVWRELETPKSLDEIITAVVTDYDVHAEQCRDDVLKFIGVLHERGLLQTEDRTESR